MSNTQLHELEDDMKHLTIKRASEIYGASENAIRLRLNYDRLHGRELYGSEKQGGTWMVTTKYMEVKYGSQQ